METMRGLMSDLETMLPNGDRRDTDKWAIEQYNDARNTYVVANKITS